MPRGSPSPLPLASQFTLSLRVDALEDCVVQAYWRATETANGAQIGFASAAPAPDWPNVRLAEGRDQLVRFDAPLDRTLIPPLSAAPSSHPPRSAECA